MMDERPLSFWGWGYRDKFPDQSARRGLRDLASAMLGGVELALGEPPRIEELSLPAPRIDVPATLAERCSSDPAVRASHTYGKGYRDILRGFRGDFACAPDLVATPRDEREVAEILDWASAGRIAVIPFGGGTSVVGGVEGAVGDGYRGVVSLDVRALDRVLEVDPISRAARIQAGARGPGLEAQLRGHGFSLRHYPQSFEFSTLGGWIATRAGGHFATLYTHIDDLVESMRVVTPRGLLETRRLPGSGAGPSPDRLLIGSEGILGVITEAWLRLHPRPRWRSSVSVRFADFERAVAATRELSQSGLYPTNCRLLDAREALLNRVATGGRHLLLCGFESADHPVAPWLERALEITASHGGEADPAVHKDAGEKPEPTGAASSWRQAFLDAPYLANALVSLGVIVDTFETSCTWDRFAELHAAVIAAARDAMKRECGRGLITCRFTHVYPDGPAPYYTFLAPGRAGAELEQWRAIRVAATDAVLDHGGTVTHHHAVGRLHRPWYDRERPELFAEALRAGKQKLDPAWVLNPGVLVDRE